MDDRSRRLRQHLALQLTTLGIVGHGRSWVDDALVGATEAPRAPAGGALTAIDGRVSAFLQTVLGIESPALPRSIIELSRPGLARMASLPHDHDAYRNSAVASWRVQQGVLHNPTSDRRTTARTFHIVEHGPAIPTDKLAVPRIVFARLLARAFAPPDELAALPFDARVRCWLGLQLRPMVAPPLPGLRPERRMEVRCLAPGGLASNLDFLEAVFGNGGDARTAADDAGTDPAWTGHTGLIVFAPHVQGMAKKELGLPRWEDASERQRRDGMCWRDEHERYHDGRAFKITLRDRCGAIATILADSYFGYGKKEVKTMISFAANLSVGVEEEHAGGALCFPRYHLGRRFSGSQKTAVLPGRTFAQALALLGPQALPHPSGAAVDREHGDILYVPEDTVIDHEARTVRLGDTANLPLRAGTTYVLPSGYRVDEEPHPGGGLWRLVGTSPHGTFIHRPATVSGGGKSELAKPIDGALLAVPIYVGDLVNDARAADVVIRRDFGDRWRHPRPCPMTSRPLLDPRRSLGSVIKLLTPSPDYSDAYNAWLAAIPDQARALVFLVKRLWRADWHAEWWRHFSVDLVNGVPGHELRCEHRRVIGSYLRVGRDDESWRTFKLRQDFVPAAKVQMEDDISVSMVVPAAAFGDAGAGHVKLVANVEQMLFQRPDDAIHPGADRQAEHDLAGPEVFCSNYEPLDPEGLRTLVDDAPALDALSEPMRRTLLAASAAGSPWTVCTLRPRVVGGKPTTNPRYLQARPDLVQARATHLAAVCQRLARGVAASAPLTQPVDLVLVGRRNNPPDRAAGIRQLAVYNPLHWQELPEFILDLMASLSGKSPSTTGAGSEGALTKGPFNALPAVHDLNAAVVSYALTGLAGFSSAAGHVGPDRRVDHDLTQLLPELLCRMTPKERDPLVLAADGCLERVADVVDGVPETWRLGWRITARFVANHLGRMFDAPRAAFDEALLRPETQDREAFAAGVAAIADAQRTVCASYIADGSVADACPPLAALIHAVAAGDAADDPALRLEFTRERVIASDWYHRRLRAQAIEDLSRHDGGVPRSLCSIGLDPALTNADRAGHLHRRRAQGEPQAAADADDDGEDAAAGGVVSAII